MDPLAKSKNQRVVIDAGNGNEHTVVCGAPNVAPGMVAAWARPGTHLEGRTIGLIAIEEVESEGMLASGEELGINRDHTGLLTVDAEAGGKLPGLAPDWIIEIDNKSLTHRPDLWGHYGMAREVAAISGERVVDPVDLHHLPEDSGHAVNVVIDDYQLCPRYSALVFENVKVEPSPLWLQARLQSIGINPINNIVDVTNYALAELPQPMHAFDADKLAGNDIFVRRARSGEALKALTISSTSLQLRTWLSRTPPAHRDCGCDRRGRQRNFGRNDTHCAREREFQRGERETDVVTSQIAYGRVHAIRKVA